MQKLNIEMLNKTYKILKVFFVITIIVVIACCSTSVTINEYLKWVEDEENGLLIHDKKSGNDFFLQYQPLEYLAIYNLRNDVISKENINKELNGLKGYYYFKFKIKPSAQVNANEDYFNYEIARQFRLIEGADTLESAFFHLESTRNFSPFLTFMLAFPKQTSLSKNLTFIYHDEVFGLKELKLNIKRKNLEKLSRLKIE
jgi:hypothetical protein